MSSERPDDSIFEDILFDSDGKFRAPTKKQVLFGIIAACLTVSSLLLINSRKEPKSTTLAAPTVPSKNPIEVKYPCEVPTDGTATTMQLKILQAFSAQDWGYPAGPNNKDIDARIGPVTLAAITRLENAAVAQNYDYTPQGNWNDRLCAVTPLGDDDPKTPIITIQIPG